MAMTIAIHKQKSQSGGGKQVKFELTHVGSGHVIITNWKRFEAGLDPLTEAAKFVDRYEERARRRERDYWWEDLFIKGVDLDTIPRPNFSSLNSMRRHLLRRLLNMMRDRARDVPRMGKAQVAKNVLPYLSKYEARDIRNVIDRNPPWTTAKVQGAIDKLTALASATDGLDHGEDEV